MTVIALVAGRNSLMLGSDTLLYTTKGAALYKPDGRPHENTKVHPLPHAHAVLLVRQLLERRRGEEPGVPFGGRLMLAEVTEHSITLRDMGDLGLPARHDGPAQLDLEHDVTHIASEAATQIISGTLQAGPFNGGVGVITGANVSLTRSYRSTAIGPAPFAPVFFSVRASSSPQRRSARYPAGSGTGSVREISTWTTIGQLTKDMGGWLQRSPGAEGMMRTRARRDPRAADDVRCSCGTSDLHALARLGRAVRRHPAPGDEAVAQRDLGAAVGVIRVRLHRAAAADDPLVGSELGVADHVDAGIHADRDRMQRRAVGGVAELGGVHCCTSRPAQAAASRALRRALPSRIRSTNLAFCWASWPLRNAWLSFSILT